jgi:outer membrane protein OmpA-like peptidoglycan-associated protein
MKRLLCAYLVLLTAASAAFASRDDVKLINRFGQVGLWHTHSAKTLNRYGLQVNFWGAYGEDSDFLQNAWYVDDDGEVYNARTDYFYTGKMNLSVGYGLTDFLDFSVMVPLYFDEGPPGVAEDPESPSGETERGYGDVEVSMKFQYPPYPHREFFKMAYHGGFTIPSGLDNRGTYPRHNYYYDKNTSYFFTSGSPEVDMKMLWTWDFRELSEEFPVLFHINYGLRWITEADLDHIFMFNAGLDIRPRDWLKIFVDYNAQPSFSSVERTRVVLERPGEPDEKDTLGFRHDPMRISPGLAFLTPGGFNFSAGAQISLANTDGQFFTSGNHLYETAVEPKAQFVASLGWNGPVFEEAEPELTGKAEPRVYSWPGAESIAFGQSLSEASLYGGSAEINGTFDFVHPDSVPDAGTRQYSVSFTPEDTVHYASVFNDISVEVENVETSVEHWPEATKITYGDALEDSELRGGRASVEGEFFFVNPDKAPDAGQKAHTVRFMPRDTVNYTISDRDITVEVEKAVPTIHRWPEAEPIKENNTLGDVSFSGGDASVPGRFSFVNENTSLTEGVRNYDMVFTPDDSDNYTTVEGSIEVEVEREAPRAQEIQRGAVVLEGVNFETGKAVLTSESYAILDRVVESLEDWPEIELRVEGHTDATGSRSLNQRLSYERAKAVVDYFISQGIAGSRLRAVGKGPDDPVKSNATAEGRAANRRVELHRID